MTTPQHENESIWLLREVAEMDPIVEPRHYYEGYPFCYFCGVERVENQTTFHANGCLRLRIRMRLGIATTQEVK